MRSFFIVLGMIASPLALAHGIHTAESGAMDGLLHPMTGIDHVLAAVGMGLWLGLQNVRGSIPLYALGLAAGIALGLFWTGMADGWDIEWILASTLIITGLFLCKPLRLPQSGVAAVITAIFSCHFYAHINEMPASLSAGDTPVYAGGFIAGTVLMIVVAAVAGSAIGRHASHGWIRIAGAAIAVTGVTAFGMA